VDPKAACSRALQQSLALCDEAHPAFAPETYSTFDQRSKYQSLRNLVGMVVRADDGGEGEGALLEEALHRARIAGIDGYRLAPVLQDPDVVVLERGNGMYLHKRRVY